MELGHHVLDRGHGVGILSMSQIVPGPPIGIAHGVQAPVDGRRADLVAVPVEQLPGDGTQFRRSSTAPAVDQAGTPLDQKALAPDPQGIAGTAEQLGRRGEGQATGDEQQAVAPMADTRIGIGASQASQCDMPRGQIHGDVS